MYVCMYVCVCVCVRHSQHMSLPERFAQTRFRLHQARRGHVCELQARFYRQLERNRMYRYVTCNCANPHPSSLCVNLTLAVTLTMPLTLTPSPSL